MQCFSLAYYTRFEPCGKQVDIIVNKQDNLYNLTLIVNKEKSVATGTSFEANCCGNLDNILITK